MGAFDGADVCNLVGFFVLNVLKKKFPSTSFGLYRDNEPATSREEAAKITYR